ncbi:hypothetical protein FF38_03362, partial [Lucilia cuprina]
MGGFDYLLDSTSSTCYEFPRRSIPPIENFPSSPSRLDDMSDDAMDLTDEDEEQQSTASYYGLTEIPDECEDLSKLEDLGSRRFNLDFQSNSITEVPFYVYEIKKLQYLNLRGNEIAYLSPMIKSLTNLKELN